MSLQRHTIVITPAPLVTIIGTMHDYVHWLLPSSVSRCQSTDLYGNRELDLYCIGIAP